MEYNNPDDLLSGRPGQGTTVRIRCRSTIQPGNEPLYVVDGIVYESAQIKSINPNDIERIDILKDAAGSAIYGYGAAHGVILITTKKANEKKFIIKDSKDRVGVGFATITATSLKTGDSVSFVANEFGRIETGLLKSLDYKLKISSAGYKTRELSLRDIIRNKNEILLQRDVIELKSVDVVGYGTIRRCITISCGIQCVSKCKWVTNKQDNQLNNVSPKWNVYPNPVAQSGTISISFPNVKEGLYRIRLTGSSGQLIYSCQKQISSKNQTEQIHLTAHTAAGIYLLQVVDEQHQTVQSSKLIVR
ncbi:MAG: TonB-dependent receptor plug domain-containing protein [Lacibacter sp.]